MQRPITLAALTVLLTGTAIAQTTQPTMRRLPTPQQQTIVKPVTQIDMQKRLPPAPRFLTTSELTKGIPNLVGKMLSGPFILSPAVRSVPYRGSVSFDNNPEFFIPNPLPPGSGGQATIRNKQPGSGNQPPVGAVKVTINAAPNQLYAVDCILAVEGNGNNYVNYWLEGGAQDSRGSAYPKQGHALFDIRGAAAAKDIILYLFPEPYKKGSNPMVGDFEMGFMDFYGCQITPAS